MSLKEKNGLIEKDNYNGESGWEFRKQYVNTQFMVYYGLKNIINEAKVLISENDYNKYMELVERIKHGVNNRYILENKIIDNLDNKNINPRNIEIFKDDFIRNKDIVFGTIDYYLKEYKNINSEGYSYKSKNYVNEIEKVNKRAGIELTELQKESLIKKGVGNGLTKYYLKGLGNRK